MSRHNSPRSNDYQKMSTTRSMHSEFQKSPYQPSSSRKNKKILGRFLFILIFLIGLGLMAFPLISQYLYYEAAQVHVDLFEQEVKEISNEEIDRRILLAQAYNDALVQGYGQDEVSPSDPFNEADHQAGIQEYARMLEVHEQIGYLSIPKITQKLPVFAGTEEIVLQKGVGHLQGTSLPVGGNNTHSVLTAHRGLPNARLFTDLNQLELGDYFYFHNLSETLAYQVDDIKVIEPSEVDHLEIIPGHDYMTLLTCTPYRVNSHRLLVRGHQVPYSQATEEKQIQTHGDNKKYKILFYITLALLLLLILWLIHDRRRQRRSKNK